jgi:hypothetical protein
MTSRAKPDRGTKGVALSPGVVAACKDVARAIVGREGGRQGVNLDHAVDFFLNVYDELGETDDPERELAEILGSPEAGRKIWQGFTSMSREEGHRFFNLALRQGDDDAIRAWCEKWLYGW